MKKIKKPVSLLIVFMMIVSVFTILPISASAAVLTGTVDMSELQVGDVIKSDVTITNNNGYSIKLPSGKIFCDDSMEILDHDVVLTDFSIVYGWDGIDSLIVKDNTAEDSTYYPINQYGYGGGEAFVVTAVYPVESIVTIETPIIYLINQIPAEVTENDKEAVENARKAYEMLTDAQKALIDADTLAKLEAAEKALLPKLVNDSEIVTAAPTVGEKISVKGAASGGSGDYTYAFYYKKSSRTDWYAMAPEFTTKTAAFKLASAVSYDVKVVVKDAEGRTAEQIYKVDVTA